MVIFNTKFRCMLIAINFQTNNFVSVLYAKYGDYGMLVCIQKCIDTCISIDINVICE